MKERFFVFNLTALWRSNLFQLVSRQLQDLRLSVHKTAKILKTQDKIKALPSVLNIFFLLKTEIN